MSEKNYTHRDCRNYAPIDVRKGMCHLKKAIVAADDPVCPKFDKMARCESCQNYKADPEKHELGTCEASMNNPKFVAYPKMSAVNCDMYKEA